MQDSELIKWIEQMRDKHGKAAGTPYEEGQWDMAQRILSRLGYAVNTSAIWSSAITI